MGSLPIDSVNGAWQRADSRPVSQAEPVGEGAREGVGEGRASDVFHRQPAKPRPAAGGSRAATVATPRRTRAHSWERLRRLAETQEQTTVALIGLALVVASWAILVFPREVPWAVILPLVVLSGALHSPRWHAAVLGLSLAVILLVGAASGEQKPDSVGAVLATVATGGITSWRSMSRARVGVQGSRGEAMLADLRTRLLRRGRVPALPQPWHAQTCVQSAYAQRFSGDFIVNRLSPDGRTLEAVLVDISGKGLNAGTRALVLSGAFDALLGAVPPADFLAAANDYVVRQDWSEGFATAVHVCLDLQTGDYLVSGAGHPPAALFRASAAAWEVVEGGAGPILGLLPGLHYPSVRGRIAPGDALLLYTDGLIEDRASGIDEGIARLVAGLREWESADFAGVARHLCEVAPGGQDDDRGAVLLWSD